MPQEIMQKIRELAEEMRKIHEKGERRLVDEQKLLELSGRIEGLVKSSNLLCFLVNIAWQRSTKVKQIIEEAGGIIVGVPIETPLAYYDSWILPPGSSIIRESIKPIDRPPDENIKTQLILLPNGKKVKFIDFLPGEDCGRFVKA